MLQDAIYDKVKLLHGLSCLSWFVEKHARDNAKKAGDSELSALLESLQADLDKSIDKLQANVCK